MTADERGGIIYGLYDPRDGQLKYVGKTIQGLKARLQQHIMYVKRGRGNSHCAHWLRGLIAKNMMPEARILETVPDGAGKLNEAECRWIRQELRAGTALCNQSPGGDGGSLKGSRPPMSAEARAKISAANKKDANPERARKIAEKAKARWEDPKYRAMYEEAGRKGSEAARKKRAGKPSEYKHSDETKAKIREARAKQEISAETGKKISQALKGTRKTHPPGRAEKFAATIAKRRQQRLEGGDAK